ncbi:MAG: tetratricopeptide repeat protein [Terriglobia bacterium]
MKQLGAILGAFLFAASSLLALQARSPSASQVGANEQASQLPPASHAEEEQESLRKLRARLVAHPQDVQTLISLAAADVKAGNPAAAEPLLAKAAKLDPKSPAIRMNWAAVLAHLRRYADADAALHGVAAPRDPNRSIEYWRITASIALGRGDAPGAAKDMEAALAVAPQNPGLILATGLAEVEAQEWDKAVQRLAPMFEVTHDPRAGLALLKAQTETHQDVLPTLAALDALTLPPAADAAFRVQMGGLLASAGMASQAAAEFERAARESPPRAELLYDLALAQFEAGQPSAALANAERARALTDSAETESLLGDIEEKRGDSLAAVHSYQAAARLNPNHEQYQMALGLDLLQHQTYQPAQAVFQAATQRFPRSVRLRIALGITDYLLEDYDAAANDLMAAGNMGKESGVAYQYLGETQLEQPTTPSAVATSQLCHYADAHPRDGNLLAYCGAMLARVEHEHGAPAPSPDAMRRLESAARLVPNDAVARCELGKAYEELKQWTVAKQNLEACARLTPDSPEAHYRLARVCTALKDMACAQEEVKRHDAAVQKVVSTNAQHDRTLRKFLYTMKASDTR